MLTTVDKQFLFDHFADKSTPLQKRRIEEWLNDPVNHEQFYMWLVEWENLSAPYLPELEAPLQRFVQHMDAFSAQKETPMLVEAEVEIEPQQRQLSFSGSPWRWLVAASVLIGVLFGGWFSKDALFFKTYRTAFGQTQAVRLTDGSQVVLQANSSLRVPRFGFSKPIREVWLTGEANFDVAHTVDNLKFLVTTSRGFDVVVYGTEFTVNTRSYRANVMLRRGKVEVDCRIGKTRKRLLLKPGDLVALEQPNRPQVLHQVQPRVYDHWKKHRFVFDNMTLLEFGQLLSENYGFSVSISDEATAQRTLVGSFQADSGEELLKIVSEIFNLTISRRGNTIQLTQSN